MGASLITSGTAVASTSGTSIDFTGIPSWVKRITVLLAGVSTNGTSPIRLQIGGGSVETSGYEGTAATPGVGSTALASGFDNYNAAAADLRTQHATFSLLGANQWVHFSQSTPSGAVNPCWVTGRKTTASTLDRVRITTVNGTDTFDAGSINILYE
jgi:hypothetical protein